MNYFAELRQAWIADTLRVFGFMNRRHLMRKFGVTQATAASDFREFHRANPGAMQYDASLRCYVAPGFNEEAEEVDPRQIDWVKEVGAC